VTERGLPGFRRQDPGKRSLPCRLPLPLVLSRERGDEEGPVPMPLMSDRKPAQMSINDREYI